MRIRWSSDLETGIRAIDLQHEELIGMINELNAAYANGCDSTVLESVLQQLAAYVVFHFGTEESLMAGLPRMQAFAEEHCRQHEGFIKHIAELREEVRHDRRNAMSALIDFLNSWLYGHILESDRALGAMLSQNMAKSHMPKV